MMDVVAAIVARNGDSGKEYLIAQRARSTERATRWEFPGGKVETGETHGQALERELWEELGVKSRVGELLMVTVYSYSDKTIRLWSYDTALDPNSESVVSSAVPTLQTTSHMGIRWAKVEDLAMYTFTEADLPVVHAIRMTVFE